MSIRACTAVSCLLLLSLTAHAADKRLDRSFDVSPGGNLTVDAEGADVKVTGSDAGKVVVEIVVSGSQSYVDNMALSAEQTSEGVAVSAKRSTGWKGWFSFGNTRGTITVSVPKSYNVDLKTSGGDLKVAQLQGNAFGRTSGGDIDIQNVHGPVRMQTSGGDITVANIEGKTEVQTSGGDVQVNTVAGDLDIGTSGGGIQVQQVTGALRARTSSGDVRATNVRGDVDLRSSGGDIDATGIDGRIRASTSGGDIDAELLGANRGVHATTAGGSIVLRMDSDVSGVLSASTSGGSIRTDLPVTTSEISERKLNGVIKGGGEEIFARTSGGNIRLQVRK